MAQRVQVLVVCDLHGDETPSDETVRFAVDGASYEIDLCRAHAAELRDALARFVGAARRSGGRPTGRRRGRRGGNGGIDPSAIREWARGQGIEVSQRGRISSDIVEQYRSSH